MLLFDSISMCNCLRPFTFDIEFFISYFPASWPGNCRGKLFYLYVSNACFPSNYFSYTMFMYFSFRSFFLPFGLCTQHCLHFVAILCVWIEHILFCCVYKWGSYYNSTLFFRFHSFWVNKTRNKIYAFAWVAVCVCVCVYIFWRTYTVQIFFLVRFFQCPPAAISTIVDLFP